MEDAAVRRRPRPVRPRGRGRGQRRERDPGEAEGLLPPRPSPDRRRGGGAETVGEILLASDIQSDLVRQLVPKVL